MQKKFDTIAEDIKKQCLAEVAAGMEEITGEPAGVIAAQNIIDIVTENYGPEIYNQALADTKKMFEDKFADLCYEIDSLSQSSSRN